jgi:predicted DNA-binding protein with PD1-like motif
MHVVLGLSDGTTRAGHLLKGWVFPTLEVVVTKTRRSCAGALAQRLAPGSGVLEVA